MHNPFNAFDFRLSELHAKRFELYSQHSKLARELNNVAGNIKEIEEEILKLHKLHKELANEIPNEQSGDSTSVES